MTIEDIAKVCHEANRQLCLLIGDTSQPTWDAFGRKQSAINGVRFRLDNPKATPEDQHKKWMKDHLADGWKFGPVKHEGFKTHPCLLEYGKLPDIQKAKDQLFIGIVDALKGFLPPAPKEEKPAKKGK